MFRMTLTPANLFALAEAGFLFERAPALVGHRRQMTVAKHRQRPVARAHVHPQQLAL